MFAVVCPLPAYAASLCDIQALLDPLEKNTEWIEGHRIDGFYAMDGTVRVQLIEERSNTPWTLFIETDRGREAPGRAGGLVILYSQESGDCQGQQAAVDETVRRIERFEGLSDVDPVDCLAVSGQNAPDIIVAPLDRGDRVSLGGWREWLPLWISWFAMALILAGGLRKAGTRIVTRGFRLSRFEWGLLCLGGLAFILGYFMVPSDVSSTSLT